MPLEKITTQQMDAKGVCAAPNILNGTPAENKAIFDRMVRQVVAPAYNACVDAVEEINAQQEEWGEAETGRVTAENGRVTAEEGRVAAENQRALNETDRQTAEETRSQTETLRKSAEADRANAESGRVKAEAQRVDAETKRAAAETARVDAENGRKSAEDARVLAENNREAQETGYVAQARAEADRAAEKAEAAQLAETGAKSAETGAKDAEKGARSWTVGGTESREGEDTDNAQYYAGQAKSSKEAAAASAAQAQANADAIDPDQFNARIDAKGDNLEFDEGEGLLYLTSGGERIGDGIKVITSGGSGAVDETLTVAGKAADAAAVGERISALSEEIPTDDHINELINTALSSKVAVEWHQCPELVRNYLANVVYDPADYTVSYIDEYAPATAVVSNYKPIGETIDGKTYYNDVPNVKSPFATENAAGTLKPLDALRWIKTRENSAEAWNVRDLGGWSCDGGTVKYGLLIRGGRITAADRDVLVGELGVQHEIDLRGKEGRDPSDGDVATESPLGGDVWFTIADKAASYALTPVATWQLYLRCVIDAVTHREPVYFHCTAGADRTGTLACVLEGMLGMSQSDIDKDYELTCFYSGTSSDDVARRRNETDWAGLINAINAVPGDSFRDKCVHFAVGTCGMSMSDINAYRAAMINGTPEPLHWYQTITKNLTGCTISNSSVQIEYGEAYTATITPDAGKEIDTVVVNMGGVDITSTACTASSGAINIAKVTGAVTITAAASVPAVTYTITRNLTNCASSNTANTIAEGAAYTTTLSPTGTYKKLGAITVTMGGTDISASAVSGSTITIDKITGSIVITCAAEITNIIDTVGISANTRLSASSGDNKTQTGYAAIGANMDASSLIHLKAGDTLRIKGASLPAANDGNSVAAEYSATATLVSTGYIYNGYVWNNIEFTSSGDIVTVTVTGEHYIRISLICTDAAAVVATINEEIT